jgi:hypothetical protein
MTSPLLGVHGRHTAEGLDEARAALDALDAPRCWKSVQTPRGYQDCKLPNGHAGDCDAKKPAMPMGAYLRSALTVADGLATENARLREALAWALGEGPDHRRGRAG